ncbi:MAG: DNA repair and recombination protein RadB [Methanomicrobiales archaeon]|nr:DNA repair and recombination protein RadB [Methanomicrobiales archaeon]
MQPGHRSRSSGSRNSMDAGRVSTGYPPLDDLLGGGLERQTITQMYGEPGSGKSTVVLIPVITCLKAEKGVIFFDTEGLSIERFRQIAGENAEQIAERLYLYEPADFEQQGIQIAESELLLKKGGIELYVMDSATALYRTELWQTREAQRKLASQMIYLIGLARRYNIPILITNQVYVDPDSGEFRPMGGPVLQHLSKAIIRIDRVNGLRKALLVKHRSLPEGKTLTFEINATGIKKR